MVVTTNKQWAAALWHALWQHVELQCNKVVDFGTRRTDAAADWVCHNIWYTLDCTLILMQIVSVIYNTAGL